MNNSLFDMIAELCAVLLFGFIFAAPAILALISSPWWTAMYLPYAIAWYGDYFGFDDVEEKVDNEE